MIFLKKYKLFEAMPKILIPSDTVKEICTPLINWNLIYDIEEASLDFLDKYYELHLHVEYRYDYCWRTLLNIKFSHSINKIRWSDITSVLSSPKVDELPNLKLGYRFALTLNGEYSKKSGGYYTNESNQVLKIIKKIYPDEKIEIFEVDNF